MTPEAGAPGDRDDIRLLRDSVASFGQRELPLTRARQLRGRTPGFEQTMFRQFADQGWTGLLMPADLGGSDLGFAEMEAVVAGLAEWLTPEPFVPACVFSGGLLRALPASPVRDELIHQLCEGAAIPIVAAAATPTALSAKRANSGWEIDGAVRFLRPGTGGSHWLLAAETAQGLAVFQSPVQAAGLSVFQEQNADGTTAGHLRCERLRLDEADCLCTGPAAATAFATAFDQALVMNAVELLAMIRRMRSMTMQYLADRHQFGRPIGSFQTLQHRAVDLLIHEELTTAVIGQAVAALDAGCSERERATLASRAKARATETAILTVRECIQMHGAIGTTDEYDLGLYVNRVLTLNPWLGNAAHHRGRFLALNPPGSGDE